MANRKIFLNEDDFLSLNISYNYITVIKLKPLLFTKNHFPQVVDGYEKISIQEINISEIIFNSLTIDDVDNINKFFVLPDNSINLITSKARVIDERTARQYITGILVEYEMRDIKYIADELPLYTLEVKSSDGSLVTKTNATNLNSIINKITTLDTDLDLSSGYLINTIIRSIN